MASTVSGVDQRTCKQAGLGVVVHAASSGLARLHMSHIMTMTNELIMPKKVDQHSEKQHMIAVGVSTK